MGLDLDLSTPEKSKSGIGGVGVRLSSLKDISFNKIGLELGLGSLLIGPGNWSAQFCISCENKISYERSYLKGSCPLASSSGCIASLNKDSVYLTDSDCTANHIAFALCLVGKICHIRVVVNGHWTYWTAWHEIPIELNCLAHTDKYLVDTRCNNFFKAELKPLLL